MGCVGTFIRQYDFLSQIVNYEDLSLEKPSIYLRHLAPVISSEQLNHEIDLSTVDFDFLTPAQARDQRRASSPATCRYNRPKSPAPAPPPAIPRWWLSKMSSPKSTTCSPVITPTPAFATSSRTSRTGSKRAKCCSSRPENNSLAQFSASPDLQNEFVGAVIGAMASSEDLSTQILNNPELSQKLLGELVPIIYQGLKTAW
jgi:type I restriction enzyme R subunit